MIWMWIYLIGFAITTILAIKVAVYLDRKQGKYAMSNGIGGALMFGLLGLTLGSVWPLTTLCLIAYRIAVPPTKEKS